MKNIIYVVDKKDSASHTAASARVAMSGGEILIANEYISTLHLLKSIDKKKGGIILFCWRKVLADILSSRKSVDYYKSLDNKFAFAFLIPDHLGLESRFENFDLIMIKASDYYVVTSQLLFNEYSFKYPALRPKFIFHDLPDINLIEKIRENNPRKTHSGIKIIWVGNSTWGHRQGFKDHKGFKSVLKPLILEITRIGNCCDVKVIDSATEYVPQHKVLKQIRDSDILLQTSKNEGTGLTILEALGLGTNVVTSKVGIALELLNEDHFLKTLEADAIHRQIHKLVSQTDQEYLYEKFHEHTSRSRTESLMIFKKNKIFPSKFLMKQVLLIKLYWIYRYILRRFSRNRSGVKAGAK